uniref:Uncharacterized protein n=1 Tax=Anopheles merus TaxID=30066 RepID=A0A182VGT1_ANOME
MLAAETTRANGGNFCSSCSCAFHLRSSDRSTFVPKRNILLPFLHFFRLPLPAAELLPPPAPDPPPPLVAPVPPPPHALPLFEMESFESESELVEAVEMPASLSRSSCERKKMKKKFSSGDWCTCVRTSTVWSGFASTSVLVENSPRSSFRAAPSCLTTAIGCFRQNSCSCGLNASFLFSKNTDGVGGWSCSRVSRVGGQSGGQGGGASADRTEQTAGTSFSSPAWRCLRTSCWMSFADIEILKSPPTEEEVEEEDDDPSKPPLEGEGSFSSLTTGSSLMSGWCCCLLPVSSCRFAPLPAAAAVVVEVASAFIGGDLVLLLVVVVEGREVAIVHEARLRHDTRLGRLVPCRQPKPTVTALLRRLSLEPGGLLLLLQLLTSLLLKAQLVLPHQPVLVGEGLQHGLLLGGQIVLVLQELQLQHLLLVKVERWHRLAGHRSDHTTTSWSAAGSAIFLLEAFVRQTIVAAHLLLLRLLSGMVLGTLGIGRGR